MKRLLYPLFLLLSILCLISCTEQSSVAASDYSFLGQQYAKTADDYLQAAQQTTGPEQQQNQLLAIGRLQQDGSWGRADQLLHQMNLTTLDPTTQNQAKILQAQSEIHVKQTDKALQTLTSIQQPSTLSLYNKIHYHSLLSQAYASSGDSAGSLQETLALSQLLPDNTSDKTHSQQQLWDQVLNLSVADRQKLSTETTSEALRGWLALANLSQQAEQDPQNLDVALDHWQQQYPNHPASQFLNTLKNPVTTTAAKHIAVLLPLQGQFAGPGQAIRDGMMASYYQQGNNRVALQFYDTNSTANVAALYQQAIKEGADFVIGPLQKNQVEALAHERDLSVPTLALNEISENSLPNNLYQFGLLPGVEASLVANRAWADGHRATLIIAPQNAWGQGIVKDFSASWHQQGGRILGQMNYDNQTNLKTAIEQLLQVDQSDTRDKSLDQILGHNKIKFTPRRRNDVDMIFLVAMPTTARQIRPLLSFYYANQLPVYATSIVYDGTPSPQLDRDINGIIFCDMPWVFDKGSDIQRQHLQLSKLWPESYNRYTRLYALGMDAYQLALRMTRLLRLPSYGIKGATGVLSLDPQHRIRRQLEWAQIQNGEPKPLS